MAEKQRKRLAIIQGEFTGAEAEAAKARLKLQNLNERYGEELIDLRIAVDRGDAARRSLVDLENLPPAVAEKLAAARQAADHAEDARTDAAAAVAEAGKKLRDAEEELHKAEVEADAMPSSDDFAANVSRWGNAVRTRRESFQAAEKALGEADKALDIARQERSAVEITVYRDAGAA